MHYFLLTVILTLTTHQIHTNETDDERSRSTSPATQAIINTAVQTLDKEIQAIKEKYQQSDQNYKNRTHRLGLYVDFNYHQKLFENAVRSSQELTTLREEHGDGKCVSFSLYENTLQREKKWIENYENLSRKFIAQLTQKHEINKQNNTPQVPLNTPVSQKASTAPQFFATIGATTLIVSFMMHSRYHHGDFSWIDKVLPWNYL